MTRRSTTTSAYGMMLTAIAALLLAAVPAFAQEPDSGPQERRFHPPRDLARATRTFVSDGWHIVTSPARMDRRDALVLASVAAATGLVYAYDEEIVDLFHRNEESDLLNPLWELGDFLEPAGHMGNTNIYYLGGLAVSYTAGWEKPTTIFTQILESHYLAGLGKNAIQYFAGRPRPFQDLGPRRFGVDGATSFPSGHSSNIAQVAAILAHHSRWGWADAAIYTAAGSVALQRIRSNAHWPSDVLLSFIYGYSVAKAVLRLHEERHRVVEPHVSALGVGAQVAIRF